MGTLARNGTRVAETSSTNGFRPLYFAELLKRPVCVGDIRRRIGRLTDLVFAVAEPYPEAVGIYLEHGWGKPTELIPWTKVVKVEDDAIFVQPPEGATYPRFVDQPGWIMVDNHLMGRTILDTDGRRIEVVNDVRVVQAIGKLFLTDVDISFNGFLRRWGLGRLRWIDDQFISWKYVQPLSLEDAIPTDRVKLSVTRQQLRELPGEDLADALEELSGKEQQALFSALDPEKAAETLIEAEPRAQRQLIEDLSKERAQAIFAEMNVAELANLFASLPHQQMVELLELLEADRAEAVGAILSEREATAEDLLSSDFVVRGKDVCVGDLLRELKGSGFEPKSISYLYVVNGDGRVLVGVVDVRDLVLASDQARLEDLMISPVVTADAATLRNDLMEIFDKYQYRMIPVVDAQDHILGVIRYKDVMKSPEARARE